jgi:hypothetical protein
LAFSLKFEGKDKKLKKIAKKQKLYEIFKLWNNPKVEIGRMMFIEFPADIVSIISNFKI